jgi:hypothetical protein
MRSVAAWTPCLSVAADEYSMCAETHPGLGGSASRAVEVAE